jgi:hypothetical protein
MVKEHAISVLKSQLAEISEIESKNVTATGFIKWRRDTEVALEKIFGVKSRHLADFTRIRYMKSGGGFLGRHDPNVAYALGLEKASAILQSIIDEVNDFGLDSQEFDSEIRPDAFSLVELLCLRFHSVARQLRLRHDSRPTLDINDEYDAQDLFHALLKIHFDDVREEEWTPSYAGGAARADLRLDEEKIFIELKKTRKGLTPKILGEELIVDIVKYASHPECRALICFVYDPEERIGNPVGIEKDLEKMATSLKLRVIIAPKRA